MKRRQCSSDGDNKGKHHASNQGKLVNRFPFPMLDRNQCITDDAPEQLKKNFQTILANAEKKKKKVTDMDV